MRSNSDLGTEPLRDGMAEFWAELVAANAAIVQKTKKVSFFSKLFAFGREEMLEA
jgi:hypothetical protein